MTLSLRNAALPIAVCLVFALPPRTPAQQAEEPVARSYDVGPLLVAPRERKILPLGFVDSEPPEGPQRDPLESDPPFRLDESKLVEMLRASVDPEVWKRRGPALSIEQESLLVVAPAATQARVAAWLGLLRAQQLRPLRLALRWYQGSRATTAALLARGPTLDEAAGKLLAAELAAGRVKALEETALLAFPGQSVAHARTRSLSYQHDMEVEVSQGERESDPEYRRVRLGRSLTLRAYPSRDGRQALVECELQEARLVAQHVFRPGPRYLATLEQPEIDQLRVATTLAVRLGVPSFLAGWSGPDRSVTWATLQVERAAQALPAPSGPEVAPARRMQVHDLRFLHYQARGQAPDWVGAPRAPSGTAGTAMATVPEPGTAPSGTQLEEVIRRQVLPESWQDSRHHVAVADGRLTVVQEDKAHEEISRLLAGLEAARAYTVLAEIDLVRLGDKGPGTSQEVDARAFEDLARSAEGSWVIATLARTPAVLSSFRARPMVADYDIEIAQGASAHDPEVRFVRSGASLRVGARPVGREGWVLGDLSLRRAACDVRAVPFREGYRSSAPGSASWFLAGMLLVVPPTYRDRETLQVQAVSVARGGAQVETLLPHGKRVVVQRSGDEALLWRLFLHPEPGPR